MAIREQTPNTRSDQTQEETVARIAFALPCLPGGGQKLRELAEQCRGPRREEFDYFHRRVGLTREDWYLQQSPQGEIWNFAMEGDPLGAIQKVSASDHPFDVWFMERVKEIHGVDFTQPLPGPPPEHIFEG
jgi:hypothetical protein